MTDEELAENLPNRLKEISADYDLTRAELAEKVGYSESYLNRIACGDRPGTAVVATKVEEAISGLQKAPKVKRACGLCGRKHYAHGLCRACLRSWRYHERKRKMGLEEFIQMRREKGRDPRGAKRVKP